MANQLYPHSSTYASSVPAGFLTSRSASDPYRPDSPCFGSSRFLAAPASASDYNATAKLPVDSGLCSDRSYLSGHFDAGAGLGTYGTATAVQAPKRTSWLGIGDGINVSGSKRALDVIYNQPVLCADNSIGQSEAWLSTSPLGKRHRFKSTSNLPMYPQRSGEKMCPHYKLTRTCKFGDNCKFAHPSWVLDGGIPDGKEVPRIPEMSHESFPERPGAPDCHYFLKTQKCKFGLSCKFNHPKANQVTSGSVDASTLPQRLSEPSCSFYLKTGTCKFGQSCKFHHPIEIQLSSVGQGGEKDGHNVIAKNYRTTGDVLGPKLLSPPLLLHNSKGLPLHQGELDCPFYMKTGSCKYGVSCRYNHPEQHVIIPPAAPGHSISSSPKIEQNVIVNPAASILQAFGSGLANVALGLHMPVYPQRPGQIECDYYMKTGGCKFGESCRFHHPIDQSVPTPKQAPQFSVKLTLAGLPRREGAVHCPFYMKTGICKYGANCKFDHPTPGDALAMSAKQGTYNIIEEEGKKEEVQLQESPREK